MILAMEGIQDMNWMTLKENIESIIDYRIEEKSVSLKDWEIDTYKAQLEEHGWINVKQDLSIVTLWKIQPKDILANNFILPVDMDQDLSSYPQPLIAEVDPEDVANTSIEDSSFVDKELLMDATGKEIASISPHGQQQVISKIKSLLKLLLPVFTGSISTVSEDSVLSVREQGIQELSGWLIEQIRSGNWKGAVPDGYLLKERLTHSMIPFLLVADSVQTGTLVTKELEKLLYSYFGGEVLLLPLSDNEWFILTNRELIEDSSDLKQSNSRDSHVEIEDTEEDVLMDFSLGLYELIASEWVGIFHIGVSKPIIPSEKLLSAVSLLKETVALGRLFHVKDHIHLPWELSLERLLYRIPTEDRADFVARADRYSDMLADEETVATLETFFKMDCNVSETAKQLYIHRNTLLYRLDKIKQETELDVRRFEDAVLMKLTLLLYKVTKS